MAKIPGYDQRFSSRRKKGHQTGGGYEGEAARRIKEHAEKIGLKTNTGGLKKGIHTRLTAEAKVGIKRGKKAWGGRRFNKKADPVHR